MTQEQSVAFGVQENIKGEFAPITPEKVIEVLESGVWESFTFTESWGHYRMTILASSEGFCFYGHHNFTCDREEALRFLRQEGINSDVSHLFLNGNTPHA